MTENKWTSLKSVEEARCRILESFTSLEAETVEIQDGLHRVLAEKIIAPHDLPRFDNSSVDGFALSLPVHEFSRNDSISFKVVADIAAGSTKHVVLDTGQAARIMTGAPIPQNADCVVPVENTDFPYRDPSAALPEYISIRKIPYPKANIRPRGQDLLKGKTVLQPNKQLNPADIGMLAMLGYQNVQVHKLPKIAIFSSGDELLQPGKPLSTGKIYDANSFILQALTAELNCHPIPLGIANDDPEMILGLFEKAHNLNVNLLITTAGVSVGAFDYVRKILEEYGKLEIWRVNMRPGKPLTFGFYKSTPVISLPGNPVSAYVGFLVFVLPVLRKMMGIKSLTKTTIRVRLEHDVESDGRESYLRAIVSNQEGILTAALTGHQGSGNLYSLVQGNALLKLPSGVQSLPAGSEVEAWLLSDI